MTGAFAPGGARSPRSDGALATAGCLNNSVCEREKSMNGKHLTIAAALIAAPLLAVGGQAQLFSTPMMPYWLRFTVSSVLFCHSRMSFSRIRIIPRNIRVYSVAQQQPQGEAHGARDWPPAGFPLIDGLASDPKLAAKSGLVEAEQAADNPHLLACLLGVTYLPPRSAHRARHTWRASLGCRQVSVRADRSGHFLVLIELFSHVRTHIAPLWTAATVGKFYTPKRHAMLAEPRPTARSFAGCSISFEADDVAMVTRLDRLARSTATC
jgi:hypothetical protein